MRTTEIYQYFKKKNPMYLKGKDVTINFKHIFKFIDWKLVKVGSNDFVNVVLRKTSLIFLTFILGVLVFLHLKNCLLTFDTEF